MGYQNIGSKLANRVIHVESLRYRGYWLDAHHSKYVAVSSAREFEVYFKEWTQFKVHQFGDYVCLESLRYPDHFMDANHTKYAVLTYTTYPNDKDWALWKIEGNNGSLEECRFWSKRYDQYLDSHHSSWASVNFWGDEWSRFRILAPTPVSEYKTLDSTSNGLSIPVVKKIIYQEGVTNSVTTTFEVSNTLTSEISGAFEVVDTSMSQSIKSVMSRAVTNANQGTREVDYDITIPANGSLAFQQRQGHYGPFTILTQDVRIVDTSKK